MAWYTYEYTSKTVTFHVEGLSYGESVRFFVRYDPNPGWMIIDGSSAYTYIATSYSMSKTFNLPIPNQAYAVNVYVGADRLGTSCFRAPNEQIKPVRPSNWYWSNYSYISQGSAVSLPAYSWNLFCSRVNDFRRYKGLADYSFMPVYSGNPMYAWQVNQAIIAINEIIGHGITPTYVYPGDTMSASFMIQLQNALNAIY